MAAEASDILLVLDRGGSSFTLKLSSKGKAVTGKKLLGTFCKQHAKKCPSEPALSPETCSLDPAVGPMETVNGGT